MSRPIVDSSSMWFDIDDNLPLLLSQYHPYISGYKYSGNVQLQCDAVADGNIGHWTSSYSSVILDFSLEGTKFELCWVPGYLDWNF
jgi:hypothetical protein